MEECGHQEFHGFIVRYVLEAIGERAATVDCNGTPASLQQLPFLFCIPVHEFPDWDGEVMPAQCEVLPPKRSTRSSDDPRAWLMTFEVAACSRDAWAPSARRLAQLRSFSKEVWALLDDGNHKSTANAVPFLLAPLRSDPCASENNCGEQACSGCVSTDAMIDWDTAEAIACLRDSRTKLSHAQGKVNNCQPDFQVSTKGEDAPNADVWRGSRQTLLESALEAASAGGTSSAASNQWMVDNLGKYTQCGILAIVTYSLRAYRLRRAWTERLAGDETLAPSRPSRQSGIEMGPGSLLQFLRERYGLDVTDTGQCVLEAANGACIRPYACPGHRHAPMLSKRLGYRDAGTGGTAVCHSSLPDMHKEEQTEQKEGQGEDEEGVGVLEPGPIRLLPEFLVQHPMPSRFWGAVRLLPVLATKLARMRSIARLRQRLCEAMSVDPVATYAPTLQDEALPWRPFRHVCAGEAPGAASSTMLFAEEGLAARLRDKSKLKFASSHSASSSVEVDWALEVATTTCGACEPYDLGRLAWLGDAMLSFYAWMRVLTSNSLPGGPGVLTLKRIIGCAVSNKNLKSVAAAPPLELHRYLNLTPVCVQNVPGSPAVPGATIDGITPGAHKKALADCFEAIVGAVVVFGGLSSAAQLLAAISWWHSNSDQTHTGSATNATESRSVERSQPESAGLQECSAAAAEAPFEFARAPGESSAAHATSSGQLEQAPGKKKTRKKKKSANHSIQMQKDDASSDDETPPRFDDEATLSDTEQQPHSSAEVTAGEIAKDRYPADVLEVYRRTRWLGQAALKFHSSAWLLCCHGDPEELTNKRNNLLSARGLTRALTFDRIEALRMLGQHHRSDLGQRAEDVARKGPRSYAEFCVGAACLPYEELVAEGPEEASMPLQRLGEVWTILESGWEAASSSAAV